MKKKVIAIALYIALLMTSLIPVTALAVGDTEGGAEPPVCTCTTKCSEGAVDSTCPVCSAEGADLSVCKGHEHQQDGDQGGKTPDGQGGEQSGNPPDNQGGDQSGNPPEGQGGNPPDGQDGNPPEDQGGNPPEGQGGNPPEDQGGNTPEDQGGEQGGNTPEDQGGNPPEDQDGNPPEDPGDDEGKPGPVVRSTVLSIESVTLAPKTYDGTTQGKVESVNFTGLPSGQSLTLDTDYSATVVYDSADAGTGRTATVTVTMENSNYSLEKNTFELTGQTIEKAAYEGNKKAAGNIMANSSLYSVQLPSIPDGAIYGKPGYTGDNDTVTGLRIENGILHYSGGSGIMSGSKYTVTVPVKGGNNYKGYDITVTLTGSDSVVLTGGPSLSSDTITYGDTLGNITLSGSMYAGATQVPGTFNWDDPYIMPKAGTCNVQWNFTSYADGLTATGDVQITVKHRPVVIVWSGPTEFTYDGQKHSVSAIITNSVEGDSVDPVYGGTLSADAIGEYTATITGIIGNGAENYTLDGALNTRLDWSIKSPVTPVSSVTMSRSSLRIYEGRSYSLSAAVSPADATNKSLYWSSSNPDIATVDQNGKVTGKAPGVCTVFAQAQDGSRVFAACTVRVLHWYPGATPITGDSSNLGLWIGVLAVSACAIAAAAFILVKKRKSK